jgi:phage shock protein PspC (stress-responsive transcriptional regulator)
MYDVDPSVLRLVMVFLGLGTGILPLLVTYLVGWIIIPKGPVVNSGATAT